MICISKQLWTVHSVTCFCSHCQGGNLPPYCVSMTHEKHCGGSFPLVQRLEFLVLTRCFDNTCNVCVLQVGVEEHAGMYHSSHLLALGCFCPVMLLSKVIDAVPGRVGREDSEEELVREGLREEEQHNILLCFFHLTPPPSHFIVLEPMSKRAPLFVPGILLNLSPQSKSP